MKPLIAIVTCERFKHRADEQRATWVPLVDNRATVKFFLAKQERESRPDEVFLNCSDDYKLLPMKVKLMFQWALANGFGPVCKMDDDTFLAVPRFLAAIPTQNDYVGFLNATPPKPWASGFCYWLSEKAIRIVAEAPIPPDEWAEDRWVGSVLHAHGIMPFWDRRYALRVPGWREPDYRTAVAICDCTGDNAHPNTGKSKTLAELQAMCQ